MLFTFKQYYLIVWIIFHWIMLKSCLAYFIEITVGNHLSMLKFCLAWFIRFCPVSFLANLYLLWPWVPGFVYETDISSDVINASDHTSLYFYFKITINVRYVMRKSHTASVCKIWNVIELIIINSISNNMMTYNNSFDITSTIFCSSSVQERELGFSVTKN